VRCSDIARAALGVSDPDTEPYRQREAVREYLKSAVSLPEINIRRLVGVGGTITTLAALRAGLEEFSVPETEKVVLTKADVGILIARLIKTGGARREHPLLRERHDVILYGAYILEYALEALGAREMAVSCSDGLEGYLAEMKRRET
jgi:exopolyphosphatase/guanosine-5'-triphosphate,3'-diphosphate pyrophosphatase